MQWWVRVSSRVHQLHGVVVSGRKVLPDWGRVLHGLCGGSVLIDVRFVHGDMLGQLQRGICVSCGIGQCGGGELSGGQVLSDWGSLVHELYCGAVRRHRQYGCGIVHGAVCGWLVWVNVGSVVAWVLWQLQCGVLLCDRVHQRYSRDVSDRKVLSEWGKCVCGLCGGSVWVDVGDGCVELQRALRGGVLLCGGVDKRHGCYLRAREVLVGRCRCVHGLCSRSVRIDAGSDHSQLYSEVSTRPVWVDRGSVLGAVRGELQCGVLLCGRVHQRYRSDLSGGQVLSDGGQRVCGLRGGSVRIDGRSGHDGVLGQLQRRVCVPLGVSQCNGSELSGGQVLSDWGNSVYELQCRSVRCHIRAANCKLHGALSRWQVRQCIWFGHVRVLRQLLCR